LASIFVTRMWISVDSYVFVKIKAKAPIQTLAFVFTC